MISPLLERYAKELEQHLLPRGILVRNRRELNNGLQLELESGEASCHVNLYHSARKGFSIVPSGGDHALLESITSPGKSGEIRDWSDGSWTGSDEAGKGDYLGPLVACAVFCTTESSKNLRDLGAADSKTLSNRAVLDISTSLKTFLGKAFECVAVAPADYNRRFDQLRMNGMNSMDILAGIHGEAIKALLGRGFEPDRILVDKFCSRERLSPYLPPTDAHLELRPGAEDDPAVAAASVIARARYLETLSDMGEELGSVLVSGAGTETDEAASELVRLHGPEVLSKCAKLHFRNTLKILSENLPDLT